MVTSRVHVPSWLSLAFLAFGFLSLLLLLCWYEISFIARLDELKFMSDRGDRSVTHVKDELYLLAVSAETESGIRQWAIRQAYVSLVVIPTGGQRTILSQLNIALWIFASNLHLSDDQVFGLWVDCAVYSCGEGLGGVTRKYFRKEPDKLSVEELASVVAMVKNPSIFMPSTVRGNQRAREILQIRQAFQIHNVKHPSP